MYLVDFPELTGGHPFVLLKDTRESVGARIPDFNGDFLDGHIA